MRTGRGSAKAGIASCEFCTNNSPPGGHGPGGRHDTERIGLVHRVVEPAELLPAAAALARQLAELPPLALRLTKRAAYRSHDADLERALELAATYQGVVQNTADHAEAVRALLERRPATFTGA